MNISSGLMRYLIFFICRAPFYSHRPLRYHILYMLCHWDTPYSIEVYCHVSVLVSPQVSSAPHPSPRPMIQPLDQLCEALRNGPGALLPRNLFLFPCYFISPCDGEGMTLPCHLSSFGAGRAVLTVVTAPPQRGDHRIHSLHSPL